MIDELEEDVAALETFRDCLMTSSVVLSKVSATQSKHSRACFVTF